MLQETYPEFALADLNLCCKCVNPTIQYIDTYPNYHSMVILPQKYHLPRISTNFQNAGTGIFHIRISIHQLNNYCLLWKKDNSFRLVQPLLSSNILVNVDTQDVLSVSDRSEDGRIQGLSFENEDTQLDFDIVDENGDKLICKNKFC